MFVLQIIIYAIGLLLIILTVLPFLKFGAWWIRIGDFPRLQIIVLSLAMAAFSLALSFPPSSFEIIFLIALAACAAYQLFCVLPYLSFYPKQVEKSRSPNVDGTISLLIFNVFIENRETGKLLNLIEKKQPDLILLAEPDEHWTNEIAELEKFYPYSVKYPLDNAYGMALYSRLELDDPKVNFFVQDDIPSITAGVKLRSGVFANLFCLHPRPPFPTENERSNERDAEILIVGRMIKHSDVPTIVAGDLNDVAWSRTTKLFQKISGLLDPRIGRGLFNSFHANYRLIRFPLDHVFHSNHFRLVHLERQPNIGSDHFPIFVRLSLEKTSEFTQEEPEADADEKQEAAEIIEETLELEAKEEMEEKLKIKN